MSNWHDQARRRIEQRNQWAYSELQKIIDSIGAREKLEYIRQNIWRCGQIDQYPSVESQDTINKYVRYTSIPTFVCPAVGLRLHFEYEIVKFVVHGGYDKSNPDVWYPPFTPESKELERETAIVELGIVAFQSERGDFGGLCFTDKKLSTPLSNLSALIEELDEEMYLYCRTAHSPLKRKAQQDQYNRYEEEQYRLYKPRKKP